MEKGIHYIENVFEYNDLLGVETLHPLVSVIDLSKAHPMKHVRHIFGFYAIFLKEVKCGDLLYGRQHYDYQEGTLVCLAPGQVIGIEDNGEVYQPKGWALVFHPDLVRGTSLGRNIREYSFFSYEVNEALLNKKDGERWGSANFMIKLLKKTCTYLLRATLDGYEDAWNTFSVKAEINDPWGLDYPLELHRISKKTLGEVTVTATKLKMYYKGDTLVYDATAFKMPDGSMLDDLIRQMPGVTMNDDGEIFVNGRKIDELLLGSRSFFGGNSKVLLENLPYYTVKNLKVYEKESDRNQAVGYEIEPNKYVMDVNLKDNYRNGYIGNVEAAGGTRERWLGRAFLLGYTDKLRFSLLGNANNVNEKRHIGESGSWKPENMPRSLLTTKSVAGEVDYLSKDGNVQDVVMVDFTTSKDEGETTQRRELFLDGSTPYSTLKASNTSHISQFLAKNSFKLTVPHKIYTDLGLEFTYNKYKGNSESISEDFLDSINTRLERG